MFFQIVLFVWQFMLDLVAVFGMADDEKDLEIMLLRVPSKKPYNSHLRGKTTRTSW